MTAIIMEVYSLECGWGMKKCGQRFVGVIRILIDTEVCKVLIDWEANVAKNTILQYICNN